MSARIRSVIGLCKAECIRRGPFHDGPLKTISDVEFATAQLPTLKHHLARAQAVAEPVASK